MKAFIDGASLTRKIRLKTKLHNHNQNDASAKWTGNNTSQFACLSISRSPAGTIIRFSSFGWRKEKKTFSSLSCTNSTERSRELRWKLHIWHSKWGYFFWRSIPVCLFVCKRSDKILYHGMQQSSIRKKHRVNKVCWECYVPSTQMLQISAKAQIWPNHFRFIYLI